MRRLQHHLDLRRGVGEDLGIGVGCRAGGVAGMAEEVGGAPQKTEAGALHVAFHGRRHRVEIRPRLGKVAALGCHVAIVEREEGDAERRYELEGSLELVVRGRHRVRIGRQPGAVEGSGAEHVGAGPVERVPQAHGDAEVILHPHAAHQPIRLVHAERERLARIEAAERNTFRDVREKASHTEPPA